MAEPTTLTVDQVDAGSSAKPRRRMNNAVLIGLAILAFSVIVAVVARLFLTDAAESLTDNTNEPISLEYWLGTDAFGRDLAARAMVGASLSLVMAVAATAISMIAGGLIGTLIWVAPRRIREFCLRCVEVATSYPELLLAVILAAILGAGPWQLVVAIGVANIPSTARLTANLAASVFQREFVTTAKLMGTPNRALIGRHLLPNMAEPLLIQLAATFSTGLVAMSALSFVGLGVQTPDYDLGRLLADGIPTIYSRPNEVMGPALMIVIISVGALLVGDGLAASADPRLAAMAKRPKGMDRLMRKKLAEKRRMERRASQSAGATAAVEAEGPLVEVRGLKVRRPDGNELVKGISFSIAPGEILGVVGESGSGKSLSAMALAQLLPDGLLPEAETMRIGDLDITGPVGRRQLARAVSLIYQDPGTTFSPALRMGSQLSELLRVHYGSSAGQARNRVAEALAKVKIRDPKRLMGSHPHELSGGMRQRAMIANALATDARLIIADEPTTALDVTVQQDILRELVQLNRTKGTSMLFISHDLAVVSALCQRVLVMREGEVVEELAGEALATDAPREAVSHPYTRMLLDSVPRLESHQESGAEAEETP